MEQKASVGRIVHYTSLGDKDGKYPPQCVPMLITAIYRRLPQAGNVLDHYERIHEGVASAEDAPGDIVVDGKAFYPTGPFDMQKVPFSVIPMTRGHWNWPLHT